jgi:hypothetical protein
MSATVTTAPSPGEGIVTWVRTRLSAFRAANAADQARLDGMRADGCCPQCCEPREASDPGDKDGWCFGCATAYSCS